MSNNLPRLLGFFVWLSAFGCAEHRVPKPVGDPALPRVGWVIMHGHKDNPDAEFGCQSHPRSECSVHASTPENQSQSEVHLYFHSTASETKYTGFVRIGFFSDAASASGATPQITVKPGDVGRQSVVGIVTDKPGTYTFSVDITAVMANGGERQVREDIPVVVSRPDVRASVFPIRESERFQSSAFDPQDPVRVSGTNEEVSWKLAPDASTSAAGSFAFASRHMSGCD
jgi:hypothetical protein